VFQALQLFNEAVYFDKFLERSAGTGKPAQESIVVRKIIQNWVVILLEKLVNDARM
jgi:hypothetical protein